MGSQASLQGQAALCGQPGQSSDRPGSTVCAARPDFEARQHSLSSQASPFTSQAASKAARTFIVSRDRQCASPARKRKVRKPEREVHANAGLGSQTAEQVSFLVHSHDSLNYISIVMHIHIPFTYVNTHRHMQNTARDNKPQTCFIVKIHYLYIQTHVLTYRCLIKPCINAVRH